jgi:glycosyltransferase involved in cell wall biosynthesis
MKVSIVIRCYKEENTIEKIIEAVRNVPVQGREIAVVDDCSQDETQTVQNERLNGRKEYLSSGESRQRRCLAQRVLGHDRRYHVRPRRGLGI